MLGFDYVVLRGANERVATWSESCVGRHWLDELVEAGRASYSNGNGFPNTYTLTAAELVPHLSRLGKGVIYFDPSMETWPDGEFLTVEAWDAG